MHPGVGGTSKSRMTIQRMLVSPRVFPSIFSAALGRMDRRSLPFKESQIRLALAFR